jgi:replicative DNA helicase
VEQKQSKVPANLFIMKLDLDWMEKIVTYKSLVDEEYLLTIIDHIKPQFFNDANLSLIFDIVCDFYNRRKSLPTHTEIKAYLDTADKKEAFKHALKTIENVDKKINKDELYDNTERFIKERGIYQTMMNVAKDVGNGNIDTGKILDSFEKTCNVTLIHDIGLDLFNDFHRVEADLKRTDPVIPSGYKWLDEKLGGGFMQDGRAMYIFAGETNIGKSIILGNLAVNIARQSKTVLVITLEMSELVYAKRLTASIAKIATKALGNEVEIVSAKMNNFKDATNGRIIIKEFPPSCMTPRDIQSYIKKLTKSNIKIDAIVLDYINLLTSHKGKDSYERVKYISEETRALTYAFKCPLITVTQLNRSGYSVNEPGLTSLSESYALGATADFITSLWQGDGDNALGIIRTTLLKNRFGINTGTNAFKIDYSTLTISEDEALNNMTDATEDVARSLLMLSGS